MGRKSVGSLAGDFFGMGVMFASFHILGYTPVPTVVVDVEECISGLVPKELYLDLVWALCLVFL